MVDISPKEAYYETATMYSMKPLSTCPAQISKIFKNLLGKGHMEARKIVSANLHRSQTILALLSWETKHK